MATTAKFTAGIHGKDNSTTIAASTTSVPHLGDPSLPNYLFDCWHWQQQQRRRRHRHRTGQPEPSILVQHWGDHSPLDYFIYIDRLRRPQPPGFFSIPSYRKFILPKRLFTFYSIHTHSLFQVASIYNIIYLKLKICLSTTSTLLIPTRKPKIYAYPLLN